MLTYMYIYISYITLKTEDIPPLHFVWDGHFPMVSRGANKCPISLLAIQTLLHPEKNQVLIAEMLEDFQFCFLQNRHKSTVDGIFLPLPPSSHQPPTGFSVFLRIVVITGTSSGLGKAATKALLRAGWEQPVKIE